MQYPDARVLIEGFSGAYASYDFNQKLSQLRASVVKSFFVRQGVAQSRVETAEMHTTEPLGVPADQQRRIKSHQVEIKVDIRPVDGLNN